MSWGGSGDLSAVLEVRGGAELGEFPHVGRVLSEAVACEAGRFPASGDVLLEVSGTPVSGLTHRDTLAVIRHFREPVRLKTVRPGECQHQLLSPRACACAVQLFSSYSAFLNTKLCLKGHSGDFEATLWNIPEHLVLNVDPTLVVHLI